MKSDLTWIISKIGSAVKKNQKKGYGTNITVNLLASQKNMHNVKEDKTDSTFYIVYILYTYETGLVSKMINLCNVRIKVPLLYNPI